LKLAARQTAIDAAYSPGRKKFGHARLLKSHLRKRWSRAQDHVNLVTDA